MRFTIHTGLKMIPFELYHGRKPRTKLTNITRNNMSYLSDRTTLNVSVPSEPIPIYLAQNEKDEVTEHMVVAKTRKLPVAHHTSQ